MLLETYARGSYPGLGNKLLSREELSNPQVMGRHLASNVWGARRAAGPARCSAFHLAYDHHRRPHRTLFTPGIPYSHRVDL